MQSGIRFSQNELQGLTFAAEAGTQRLRNVINKNVTWDEIEKTCTIAFNAGYIVARPNVYAADGMHTSEFVLNSAT